MASMLGCGEDDTPAPSAPRVTESAHPPASFVRPIRPEEPGSVTARRLNRAEYNNTVRDVLGTSLRPADVFPEDDFGGGFNNMADVLSLSPLHVEMYERAADDLLTDLLGSTYLPSTTLRYEAEDGDPLFATVGSVDWTGTAWALWSNGELRGEITVPYDGRYLYSVALFAEQGGPDLARSTLSVEGLVEEVVDVVGTRDTPEVFTLEIELTAGSHSFAVSFDNDYWEEDEADRNLYVDWLAVEGPIEARTPPKTDASMLLLCDPEEKGTEACAEFIARAFGERAWRRPLREEEVEQLLAIFGLGYAHDEAFVDGVRLMAKAMLLSPHFVFRVEPPPKGEAARDLTSWELASRLSYFLWSSTPDETLLSLARDERLLKPEIRAEQVRRMLADEKADALADNLMGQWLYTRAVDELAVDAKVFPDVDDALREAMGEEMRRVALDVIREDRSMLDLLTREETWVNGRLAEHYGLSVRDDAWQAVSTAGTSRVGWLGTAGLLASLSHPTRTSPVLRGKWVLTNLMCEAPAPPPPNVEALAPEDTEGSLSLREQMEQHRADPVCASCHAAIDPIGFALEHFDASGAYRDMDVNGHLIDATGAFPDGSTFDGLAEMAGLLAASPKVPACMSQKVFTYALGRAPTVYDVAWLEEVGAGFEVGGYRFEALVLAIVESPAFLTRGRDEGVTR